MRNTTAAAALRGEKIRVESKMPFDYLRSQAKLKTCVRYSKYETHAIISDFSDENEFDEEAFLPLNSNAEKEPFEIELFQVTFDEKEDKENNCR